MKKQILTLFAALLVIAAVSARPAAAQNLNQMIQNQIRMQQRGDQAAMNAARAYYAYAVRMRQMGYTGQIPTGVTPQSLSATNQQLMQAGQNYIRNSQANMNRTWDATTSTSNAITRGCNSQYWNGTRWICQ